MSGYDDEYEDDIPLVEPNADERQPFHPFQTIWLHPRETVRRLVGSDPGYRMFTLIGLAGITESLGNFASDNKGDHMMLASLLVSAILSGLFSGWVLLWLGSYVLHLTGRSIGGRAPGYQIKTAMAWGSVPTVAALGIWFLMIIFFGSDLFTTATPRIDASSLLQGLNILASICLIGLGGWSLVLFCHALAEVQGFSSAWKGFVNLMLALTVVVIPVIILLTLFSLIALVT